MIHVLIVHMQFRLGAQSTAIRIQMQSSMESFKLIHTHITKSEGSRFPTVIESNKLIESYSKSGLIGDARHLFNAMPERNVFTWNAMIHGYIKNKNLAEARLLFDSAPGKDSVAYNSMISGYVGESNELQAIELLAEMQRNGTPVDEFTLTTMLNVAAKIPNQCYGRQIQACMVKTASNFSSFSASSLIDMYSKCGCFSYALRAFREAGEIDLISKNAMVAACCREGEMELAFDLFWGAPAMHDTVSWNTLISGCSTNGHEEMALELFVKMDRYGIRKNEHTLASAIMACSSLKSIRHGIQVHAWVLKNGLCSNPYISSGIVDFYCKCDDLKYAESVHAEICEENVFSTTSLIVGHSRSGNMEEARRLFDSLVEKNSVVWTALFSGYNRSRQCDVVIDLFREYRNREEILVPDMLVIISVIGACTMQAHLDQGKQVHAYLIRMGFEMGKKLGTALVDMYAKCGAIKYAKQLFIQVPSRDRVLYNAMMAGFAHHGQEKDAIHLFEEMLDRAIGPDTVTFIALLSACRHAGLVEAGEMYFQSMEENYGIPQEAEHYSSMVDLFGRANRMDKALSLMANMPFEPDAILWGTFLNACRMNGNTKLAREAEEKLLRMEVNDGSRYVQLANAYAAKGEWREVERVRRKMRGREVKKLVGCSWVQVGKSVNIFTSGDTFHSEGEAIYGMLDCLNAEMTWLYS